MSDEKQPSDAPPKTRRRRRRKPVGAAPANKSESQESAGQASGGQVEGGPAQAGPGRQRNRKRRSRKRENANSSQGSSDSQTGEKAEQSSRSPNNSQSRRPSRSRRNAQSPRGSQSRRDSEEKSKEGLDRNHNRSTQPAQNDAPAAADDSFRDNPPIAEPVRAPQVAGPNWGDDSDAPTPDIELKADLPPDSARRDLDPTSTYLLDQEEGEDFQGALSARICNVISVRFAVAGRLYLYDAGDGIYKKGDKVLVESDRGERIAIVAVPSQRRPPPRSLKKILGRAKLPSQEEQAAHEARDRDFLKTAIAEAKKLKLSIKVFRATLEDGDRKLAISYSCESKTDVRRLSRALSNQYSHRVDLRHFGARDEAKLVGGIGSCGQELCCTTWLPSFVPVSIKNAKDQGLVLNPSKVSGQCGRLKCCLVYEQDHYAELRKGLPKLGKRVITQDGFEGRVVEVDVLHQRIRVGIGRGESKVYGKDEVKPMFASQAPGKKKDKPPPTPEQSDTNSTAPDTENSSNEETS